MKTERVKRTGYTMVYSVFEAGIDFDPSDDLHIVKCLSSYELDNDYRVWKIGATYAKHLEPTMYYIAAKTKKEAVTKFLDVAPWLSFVKVVMPVSDETAHEVLTNPARYIMW